MEIYNHRSKKEFLLPLMNPQPGPEDQPEFYYLTMTFVKGGILLMPACFGGKRNNPEDDIVPHTHDCDKYWAMFGTNMDDPHDLCGECASMDW
jgi:hypothetical protein